MKRLTICVIVGGALFLVVLTVSWNRYLFVASTLASFPTGTRELQPPPEAQGAARRAPLPANRSGSSLPALAGQQAAGDAPDASSAFAQWANRFLSGNPATSLVQGQALAWKRREAMLELIERDPEKAIAAAASFRWRSALPPGVTRYLEKWVDGRGSLNIAVGADFERTQTRVYREVRIRENRYAAFVYGRRLRQASQSNVPLHGIILDGKMAVLAEPMRLLEPDEARALEQQRRSPAPTTCPVCNQPSDYRQSPVAADIGGEVAWFCGSDHARLADASLSALESGGGRFNGNEATAANDLWTHGPKSVLYMRVNFPDDLTEPISEAAAYDVMNSANAFYAANSYNLTTLTATVTPLVTLPESKGWYGTAGPFALLEHAREAVRDAGYDTDNYDLDIASFTPVPGYNWGGLALVHAKGAWLQSQGATVTCHELGHNYGLLHANFWDTSTSSSIIASGTNVEYGNIFDTMGSGSGQFGTYFKNQLDWITAPAVCDVRSNGIYRIYGFDVARRENGLQYAARVRKDFMRDYWIEFRQGSPANSWLQNGVLLNWSPWDENGGVDLLDTTPGTPSGALSRADAALVIGRTFSDAAAGVHITPLARGTAGTNAWIDVNVSLGAFPENQPPEMALETEFSEVLPGTLVHFHATATDPDGDPLAYAWTFDDLSFSTNNLPWTAKNWSTPGDHVVRCVVSDMKGGVASANAIVTVGAHSPYRIFGHVTDTNGIPLEGVRVESVPDSPSPYLAGYTDSDGKYVIVGAQGFVTLQAVKYGFTLTNETWENPIYLDSDVMNANFVARPLPVVTIVPSTNLVSEDSGTAHYFSLTRTGETGTNLEVTVYLSGTAVASSDFNLVPALRNGTNLIEFSTNVASVEIALTPVNDTTVEASETVTLTVADDPAYVVGPAGEATITIMDDDEAARPTVSVAAATPSVIENGMDGGIFEFTRSGSTRGNLPVFYSVSGSATPGTDYTTLVGVAVIPDGSASTTIQFQTLDDKEVEGDETVSLSLLPQATYEIGTSPAQISILDDDVLAVTVAPTDSGASEPSTAGRFTVKREGDLTGNLTVYYAVGGTASSDLDYEALSGWVTISAGSPSADIVVRPKNDTLVEGDESVAITLLTNAVYNIGAPGSATLLIRDDEQVSVRITATDNQASELGDDVGTLVVSRGSVGNGDLAVNLAISGTAVRGVDYVPLDNPVIIPNGSSSLTINVIPFHDLHYEPDENVIVTLAPGPNYNLGSPRQASVVIADDNYTFTPAAGFTFAASSADESRSPGVSVTLSATSSIPVTVDYLVIGGTASSADYGLGRGPLTFEPGEQAKSIPLHIVDDTTIEQNETIRLALFDPVNATLDGIKIHTYTILDNDTAVVAISATSPDASESGPVQGNFRITRTGSSDSAQVVNFQVAGSASAPADYAPLGNSVTIPAGAAFVDLPVVPVMDHTVEHSESVIVTLLSAPGATIPAPGVATVTIADADTETRPLVWITSTNRPYAVEGGDNGEFVFTRSGTTTGALTLHVSVSGTATADDDYASLPSSVTIPPGQSSVTMGVAAVDDAMVEGEETVQVALTARDTYRAAYPASAIVTVQDNDQRVRLDASDFSASEPGADEGEFTFTRFGTTNTPVRIFYAVSGTARNGVDYAAISNSFTIPAGSLSATLPILPIDDTLVEGPETVTLTLLGNPSYYLGFPTNGTVILMDDEPMLTLTASTTNIVEGNKPPAYFTINRAGDPDYDFTAHLAVGGAATYGLDYPPFLTNVYFSCGVTAIDLLISPTNELAVEGDEDVVATLLPDPDYTVLDPATASINIEDAGTNQTPAVTITSPTVNTVFLLGTNVNIILEATVADDSDTNTPPTLTWSKVNGPDTLVFGETNQADTTVSFTNAGVYVLRLTADDGQLQNYAEVTAVVGAAEMFSTNSLHWPLDETNGLIASDISGAGRDGILEGAPDWDSGGVLGGALDFNGAGDSVRQTGGTNFLNGLKALSVALWINATVTNADQGILCANDSGTNLTLALSARTYASCGLSSNVIEAVVPSSRSIVRHISASDTITNGWQHLALTWSNGLAPALYIDGQLDQPQHHMVALRGTLAGSPQLILGRNPLESPNSWHGKLDDVRVFTRALTAEEVGALAGVPPANYGAVVKVLPDVTNQVVTPLILSGEVTDDGRPLPPGRVSNTWSQVSGPAEVTIPDAHRLTNTVEFIQSGDYVFRLVADDGQVKVFDDVAVTVVEPTLIYCYCSDSEAAELGPDTGQFTVYRVGDLSLTLPVYLDIGGTASNGVDFIAISNVVTFTPGSDTVTLDIRPFLDQRIEGDEPLTLNAASNLAYTIGGPEAIMTIHDSPYGAWSVAHFSLEELTDPTLSSEAADFDHDGLVNFAEYAADRDPRTPETNPPLAAAVEVDPADGTQHITVTYTRRLQPTDTAYQVCVSDDLRTWHAGDDYVREIQATDDGNGLTETVKARLVVPYPSSENQFVTVRVWLEATGP